jgi:membrane peptidoglycan carboxypeptidase
MLKVGGMTTFVNDGWAGKDYTHINYAGGREIARALYFALLQGAQNYSRMLHERIEQSKPVITEPLQEIDLPTVENTLPPTEQVVRDTTATATVAEEVVTTTEEPTTSAEPTETTSAEPTIATAETTTLTPLAR